jgi:hypothetical protein
LTQEGEEGLRSALRVWTTDIKGLTKMVTRMKVAWQQRECRSDGYRAMPPMAGAFLNTAGDPA